MTKMIFCRQLGKWEFIDYSCKKLLETMREWTNLELAGFEKYDSVEKLQFAILGQCKARHWLEDTEIEVITIDYTEGVVPVRDIKFKPLNHLLDVQIRDLKKQQNPIEVRIVTDKGGEIFSPDDFELSTIMRFDIMFPDRNIKLHVKRFILSSRAHEFNESIKSSKFKPKGY